MRKNLLRAAGLVAAVVLLAGCGAAAAGAASAPRSTATRTVIVRVIPTPHATTAAPQPTVTVTAAPPASVAPAPRPALVNADAVVTQYYQDITDQDYAAAWALGGPDLNAGTSYASWAAGYATTASISLGTFSLFGSDQVAVSLSALQDDGSVYTYQGTYTVQGGLIVSANIVQTG